MFHKILLAYDGSESAEKAYALAIDLAQKYGANLVVLAVARPPEFGSEEETEAVIENSRRHYDEVLQPLPSRVAAAGVSAHFEVSIGHPAEQVMLHAEKHGADLIVMGHRGRSLLNPWLLGSVAKQVINHARCAVLVAR